MKIFIDAFGDIALLCIKQLFEKKDFNARDLLVRTYSINSNDNLIDYLKDKEINYFITDYDELSIEKIISFKPEFVLSLFARVLIPKEVVDCAKYSMNLHPSLLPNYKGCFSVPWVIINDEKETGITFHEISERFDEGRTIFQKSCKISTKDTAQSLYSKINFMFFKYFLRVFDDYINGFLLPTDQLKVIGSYYPRKLPYDGIVDTSWDNMMVDRFIRAMFYPPFTPAVNFKEKIETGKVTY